MEVLDSERCTTFEDCVAWARRRFQVSPHPLPAAPTSQDPARCEDLQHMPFQSVCCRMQYEVVTCTRTQGQMRSPGHELFVRLAELDG